MVRSLKGSLTTDMGVLTADVSCIRGALEYVE
jgi:hypothetical protein